MAKQHVELLNLPPLIEWDDLVQGRFIEKVNRFAGYVEVAGVRCYTHIPNPTPARELLTEGADVLLIKTPGSKKTKFRLLAAKSGSIWATLDTAVPNVVFREAIGRALLPEFAGRAIKKEGARLGKSIIDFQLSGGSSAYVEVKSCTLVRNGTALFPDAITERGRRHLTELEMAVSNGGEAYMVWIIQRPDAEELKPFREKDPAFAEETVRAKDTGVGLLAYKCRFDTHSLSLVGRVPVVVN